MAENEILQSTAVDENNDYYIYNSYALYYRLTGEYDKALDNIEKSLHFSTLLKIT